MATFFTKSSLQSSGYRETNPLVKLLAGLFGQDVSRRPEDPHRRDPRPAAGACTEMEARVSQELGTGL